jgi:SAM-dependent methyltransferase
MDAASWDARYAASDLVWGDEPNRFVVEELAKLPPGRALDAAAGEGRNALWLAECGWQVTAVDFSAVAIARGRHLAEARGLDIAWVVADLDDFEPEPQSFDAVIVAYLHVSRARFLDMLSRLAQAVASGGRIVVIGHDLSNLDDGIGGPSDPDILYTADLIVGALAEFTVVRADRAKRPVPTDEGVRHAIDTVVTAVRT